MRSIVRYREMDESSYRPKSRVEIEKARIPPNPGLDSLSYSSILGLHGREIAGYRYYSRRAIFPVGEPEGERGTCVHLYPRPSRGERQNSDPDAGRYWEQPATQSEERR
jgi:hypothetical protein